MGWNTGFTIFEATVIGAYDLGVLDKKLLTVLMKPYSNTDIDSGGCMGLKTKDGKGIQQVVIETFGGTVPEKPKLPKDYRKWTDEQRDANDEYHERVYGLFNKVTKKFKWR